MRQTDVLEAVAGSSARFLIHSRSPQNLLITLAFAWGVSIFFHVFYVFTFFTHAKRDDDDDERIFFVFLSIFSRRFDTKKRRRRALHSSGRVEGGVM